MEIFFDTEFTGLFKDTELISIGLVTSRNNKFYAEINDFNNSNLDKWIKDNIISKLLYNDTDKTFIVKDNNISMKDSKINVSRKLNEWLKQVCPENENIQFVSDVSSYDFVLLVDLISGNSLDLPKNITPYCYDINQELANKLNISNMEAFDLSREEFVKSNNIELGEENKHNSLFDAEIIACIYKIIKLK